MKISKKSLIFLSLLSLLLHLKAAATEAEALLNWKNSLSSSRFLESWSHNNITNLCRWPHIHCNDGGSVSMINLSGASLAGCLDMLDFASLPNVTSLNLSRNVLNGSIPAAVGNLSRITLLDLSSNSFSGRMPDAIGTLSRIILLDLSENLFNGSIPAAIGNLSRIILLDLSNNRFSGPISFSEGRTRLKILNHIYGSQNGKSHLEKFPMQLKILVRETALAEEDSEVSIKLNCKLDR